jgi:hypothetical protein
MDVLVSADTGKTRTNVAWVSSLDYLPECVSDGRVNIMIYTVPMCLNLSVFLNSVACRGRLVHFNIDMVIHMYVFE